MYDSIAIIEEKNKIQRLNSLRWKSNLNQVLDRFKWISLGLCDGLFFFFLKKLFLTFH